MRRIQVVLSKRLFSQSNALDHSLDSLLSAQGENGIDLFRKHLSGSEGYRRTLKNLDFATLNRCQIRSSIVFAHVLRLLVSHVAVELALARALLSKHHSLKHMTPPSSCPSNSWSLLHQESEEESREVRLLTPYYIESAKNFSKCSTLLVDRCGIWENPCF